MESIIWIIIISLIASYAKKKNAAAQKNSSASLPSTKPRTGSSPGNQRSGGLREAMTKAIEAAGEGGALWAKQIIEANHLGEGVSRPMPIDRFEEPEAHRADPEHSHEGYHETLSFSGEGDSLERDDWNEMPHGRRIVHSTVDPCRSVGLLDYQPIESGLNMEGLSHDTARRASRRTGSVTQGRRNSQWFTVNSAALHQGIIWNEILSKRGGRNMHR